MVDKQIPCLVTEYGLVWRHLINSINMTLTITLASHRLRIEDTGVGAKRGRLGVKSNEVHGWVS